MRHLTTMTLESGSRYILDSNSMRSWSLKLEVVVVGWRTFYRFSHKKKLFPTGIILKDQCETVIPKTSVTLFSDLRIVGQAPVFQLVFLDVIIYIASVFCVFFVDKSLLIGASSWCANVPWMTPNVPWMTPNVHWMTPNVQTGSNVSLRCTYARSCTSRDTLSCKWTFASAKSQQAR
jgi:hypothetical protein